MTRAAVASIPFRFDEGQHAYTLAETGEVRPHITGMLEKTGWIDDTWYTEESCVRGTAVHRLTADYDLGVLDPDYTSGYKGWVDAYVEAIGLVRATIVSVEEPLMHPVYRYGGRIDRVVLIAGVKGIIEIKTGGKEKSHQIQTALQAILLSPFVNLPPWAIARRSIYVKENGKYKCPPHEDRRDFDEAHRIIKETC